MHIGSLSRSHGHLIPVKEKALDRCMCGIRETEWSGSAMRCRSTLDRVREEKQRGISGEMSDSLT